MPLIRKTAILVSLLAWFGAPALADEISGAGATFPYPLYVQWAETYQKETGVGLSYQAIGSGGGIRQIKAGTVTFGASDKPLTPEDLAPEGLLQWPMVIGGVVPIVNIKDIGAGDLILDGDVLANIYLGAVRYWDDTAIRDLNPKLALPHQPIVPVTRTDASGTNFLFTTYLSTVSKKFERKIGAHALVEWTLGIGAKGNEGITSMTGRTEGAIGYVEYTYATQAKLAYTRLVNREGHTVLPNFTSFQAAAVNGGWKKNANFDLILTDQPGIDSWPLTGASFILMPKKPSDTKAAQQALTFFDWAFQKGGDMAKAMNYVPVPENLVPLIRQSWKQIEVQP